MLMTTVQLPGAPTNDSYMVMHTSMGNKDVSLARYYNNIFQNQHMPMALLIVKKIGNELVSLNGLSVSIMFRT